MADRILSERYRIVRHLARGGMAEVYLAQDQLLDRPVAVKVLFPELAQDSAFVERFRREARAAAGLNHHNIVSVYDFGEDEGSYFIVMEYVEGQTLRDIVRSEGPLEPSRVVEIGAEVAAALAVAHANGIVHRDVKPGNVLISGTVKVADFGIARAGDPRDGLTQTGAVMGTATYLSPEQAQGHDIDLRSDVYSLGVVLYEMATGRPPFTGSSPVAIAYKHMNEAPTAPSAENPAIPPALDVIVLKALAKAPADRYSSAEELRADLLAVTLGPPELDATVLAAPVPGSTSTEVMAPVAAGGPIPPGAGGAPVVVAAGTPAEVYRRRRLTLIGLVALLILAVVAVVALARGGGGTATVPTVVGLSIGEATAELARAGLRSRVEPRPGLTGDPTKVSEQRPGPDSRVDRSTVVILVVPGAAETTSTEPERPTTTETTVTTVERPATTRARPSTVPSTAPPTTAPRPTTTEPTTPST